MRCLQPFKLNTIFVECALAEGCQSPCLQLLVSLQSLHMACIRVESRHKASFNLKMVEDLRPELSYLPAVVGEGR